MVTVDLNDDLKQKVGGDQSITIKVGTGELTFNNNDIGSGRAGFFEAAEVSNIIIVHFQGTVDGEWTEEQTSFSNVKGGEHRNIVFNLEIPSVGDMGLSVKLDAVCKKVDLLAWANPGAEDILPEDPSVNPGTSAPTIVGQGFNIMDEIEVEKDETKTIIVNITADNGIQNLKVKIDSETLTPEILKSVGLSSEFDLAHPANADLEKALKSLGFPVDIPTGTRFWKGIMSCKFPVKRLAPRHDGVKYAIPVLHLYWRAENSNEWILLRCDADYLFNCNYTGDYIWDETTNYVKVMPQSWH
jgi:hypothetical protein